jgi:YggT family protein
MFFFVPPVSPAGIVADLIELLIWAILIEALVSNVIAFGGKLSPRHPAVVALRAVVNPILNPVRRILPPPSRTGGWDLSPLIVIFLLQMLRSYLFFGR